MSEFYILRPGLATRYIFASVDTKSMGEASYAWSFRQLADFQGTARLTVSKGTVAGDLMDNSTNLLVVSGRVVELLREVGVESFTTYDVDLAGKSGEKIPGYKGMGILGEGGPNDPSLTKGFHPGTRIKRIKGLKPTAWDGSDLFTLDDVPRIALVTRRLKEVMETRKLSNCWFRPSEQFRI